MIPSNLLIINYHKIEKQSDIGITTRHPDEFEQDLDDIVSLGYETINFLDIQSHKKLPAKPLIITFDDAYTSFYDTAFKLLTERGMTAVVYVPVEYIGKMNDWDVQFGKKKYQHMSTQQLREIGENNIEIGSHTLNHKFLNNLSSKEIENELYESKTRLQEIVDKPVISISYPFGKFNNTVLELSEKYYDFGLQLLPSIFKNNRINKYTLSRINIYRIDSRNTFKNKLNYHKNKAVFFKTMLIQQGAWATILLNKMRGL